MAQLAALISGVVLGGVAEVVGSNLARGKIFTASIGSVDSLYLLFVCLFVALRPKSTAMVIAGRSVHLTTLFPGQA